MTSSKFYNFPSVTAKAWKQLIQVGLKGADYNESLIWEGADHIKVKPFYNSEDLNDHHSYPIATPASWKIGQVCYVQTEKAANKKAAKALSGGAESLYFIIPSPEINIKGLLKGIDLTTTPIHLQLNFVSEKFIEELATFKMPESATLYIHMDVLGGLARTGNWKHSMEKDMTSMVQLTKKLPQFQTISIDGTLYQNAGGNRVQQLAYMLLQACEYLHLLGNQKNTLSFPIPVFKVAIDSDYFFEIAKLRALRLLWKSLASVYKAPENCHIVAQPSKRNKTLYEYNTNLLRSTTECMAAINGGADTVFNLPYDAVYHKDHEFGERIARNQLLILRNESYFGEVSNPADGAYYIESLTTQLAEKALDLFKNMEASGGFLKALKQHSIQKKIREQAESEQQQFERGDRILVGSNAYVNPKDSMKEAIEIYPFLKTNPGKTLLEPILEKRLAESIEQKRLDNE